MGFIFTLIKLLSATLVAVETMELMHDTDYLLNAQYFDCLHYTNERTNTYSIKYCIQPKNIFDFRRQTDLNETRCGKSTIAHLFSSLFEQGIDPNTVLSTFRSGN